MSSTEDRFWTKIRACSHKRPTFDTYCDDCVAEARALLKRILTALDEEAALAGPVPFDPEEIRKFLEASG